MRLDLARVARFAQRTTGDASDATTSSEERSLSEEEAEEPTAHQPPGKSGALIGLGVQVEEGGSQGEETVEK